MNSSGLFAISLALASLLTGCNESVAVEDTTERGIMAAPAASATRVEPGREAGAPRALEVVSSAPERVAAPPAAAADPEALRSYTEEEDFDGDGIADTRTIRRFKYDASGRPCRLVTERDFDADGTIDARTTNISAYGDAGTCGT